MPPKVKVTREDIINAAVEIVRSSGEKAINARTVASVLQCSTQPVFSNFTAMEELRLAVVEKADAMCREYMQKEVKSGAYPAYKATGIAYIRFAQEEKELFKLVYMRDRSREQEPMAADLTQEMEDIVRENTGLNGMQTQLFHLEMWAFVHGIAAMLATNYLELSTDMVSQMLTDVYQGLIKHYKENV